MKWVDFICILIFGTFILWIVNPVLFIFAPFSRTIRKLTITNAHFGLKLLREWEKKYGPLEWD